MKVLKVAAGLSLGLGFLVVILGLWVHERAKLRTVRSHSMEVRAEWIGKIGAAVVMVSAVGIIVASALE